MAENAALLPAGNTSIKNATAEIRLGFVRKVYGILSAQLILTVLIAAPIVKSSQGKDIEEWQASNGWLLSIALFGMIISSCAMCWCMKQLRTFPANYIFLLFITVAESAAVGYMSALYTWQSVLLATGLTTCIFISMTIYAWTTTVDFTGFGPYLFAALMAMIFFCIALMILSAFGVPIDCALMAYNFCGVLLFTFFIVFDTQCILGEYGGHKHQFDIDDYCFAALALYLDIIELFIHILRLLGDRR